MIFANGGALLNENIAGTIHSHTIKIHRAIIFSIVKP